MTGSRVGPGRTQPDEHRIDPAHWEEAISQSEGPQLIVAGPGTGKTDFLVRRARHLVDSGKAQPAQILLLTFSRRAAAEIAHRATSNTGASPVAATFHSFARRLLEAHGSKSHGWTVLPALLTGPEQVALVTQLMKEEDPASWPAPYRPLLRTSTLAEEVADFLMRCRERLLGPEDIGALAAERTQWRALPAFMVRYETELGLRHRMDYGVLLAATVKALEVPAIRQQAASQYRYVLVDEYQDVSAVQARILELLTEPHRNITVTGDPYQSIYSFRGADLTNLVNFVERFRDLDGRSARRLILTTSFRVPGEILAGADRVVAGGELPGGAGPVTPANHSGRVEAYVFDQASAEAEWIAAEVERLHLEQGLAYSRLGVLVRSTRHLLPELSRALERHRIPHDAPDRRLVDHPAIRLILDLVEATWTDAAAAVVPEAGGLREQADRAMRRLLLGPLFCIPLSRERDLLRKRRRSEVSWSQILSSDLPEAKEVGELLGDPDWAIGQSAAEGFWTIWSTIPQFANLVEDPSLKDFHSAWAAFSQVLLGQQERDPSLTLADYQAMTSTEDFEASPLLSLERPGTDQLTLTTLHQAKGLEFDVVFIADAAEGVFPDLRRSAALLRPEYLAPRGTRPPETEMRSRLSEEMRLAYTAMTRARQRVIWTATSAAIDEGERRPSRFLLAASGKKGFDEITAPPPVEHDIPVTTTEAQAMLRRNVTNPAATSVDRLAALAALAHPANPVWDASTFAGTPIRGPDTGVIRSPVRLSPSQAEAYSDCPRRYVFERRLGAGDTFSPHAHFGSLIHHVLEMSEGLALDEGAAHADLARTVAVLDDVWAKEADFGSPVLNEAWKNRGRQLLRQMHDKWPGGSAVVVASERTLHLEVDGIRWSGRADRIERHQAHRLRVVDYKTGTSPPTKAEAAESLQLGFYMLAAANDPDLIESGTPDSAQYWYPMAKSSVREFDPKNLEALVGTLKEIGQGIVAEEFPATPGGHCKNCTVRLVCPAWPEGREAYVS